MGQVPSILTEILKLLPPTLPWHHEVGHIFFPYFTDEGTEEQEEKSRKKTSYSTWRLTSSMKGICILVFCPDGWEWM